MNDGASKKQGLWDQLRAQLEKFDVSVESLVDELGEDAKGIKMVVVSPHLKQSVEDMGKSARDHTVMVRVDEAVSHALDQWVETGAVKSRSEAAALFIREGLRIRESELAKLQSALLEVEEAKSKLRDRAREVFGDDSDA